MLYAEVDALPAAGATLSPSPLSQQGNKIMPFLFIFLILGGLLLFCEYVGMVAFSVVVAALACLMGACTAGLASIVITKLHKMNYATAFNRSFIGAAAVMATIILAWTALLDMLAGGLTTSWVVNLWHVSLWCACCAFLVGLGSMVTWCVMVFRNRKHRA